MDGEGEVTSPRTNARTPRGAGGRGRKKIRRSVTLPSEQVARLGLRPGKNVIAFSSRREWGRRRAGTHACGSGTRRWCRTWTGPSPSRTCSDTSRRWWGSDWNHEGGELYSNIGWPYRPCSSPRRHLAEQEHQRTPSAHAGRRDAHKDPSCSRRVKSPPRYTARVARHQEFKMRLLRRDLFPLDEPVSRQKQGHGRRVLRARRRASRRNFTINPKSEVVAETTRMTKRTPSGDQRARGRDVPPGSERGTPRMPRINTGEGPFPRLRTTSCREGARGWRRGRGWANERTNAPMAERSEDETTRDDGRAPRRT